MVTSDDFIDLPAATLDAIRQHAEWVATLIGEYLLALSRAAEIAGTKISTWKLPRAAILELGAILQLKYWEDQGIRCWLPASVPSYDQAAKNLIKSVTENPEQFYQQPDTPLSRLVLFTFLDRIHWSGSPLLQTNLVIGDIDEDLLIEGLAQLLWQNRHTALEGIPKISPNEG